MPSKARRIKQYKKNLNSGQNITDPFTESDQMSPSIAHQVEHWNDDVEEQITESSKYQDVHVVDINGRVMDHSKTPRPKDDLTKSLPRNFLIRSI